MALEKFCLCCKLRNGVVILGVMSIIFNSIALIFTLSTEIFEEEIRNDSAYQTQYNNYEMRVTPVYWLMVASSIIGLLLAILLVVGAVKRNHFLMLPWIIVTGIAMIPFALATFGVLILALPIYGPVYVWWCVCSAYQKVQEHHPSPYSKFDSLSLSDNLPNREILP